jgi:hypothetical protein
MIIVVLIIAYVSGVLTCLAFCWKRLRESRRAFNAASESLDIANEKNEELCKRNAHLEEKISNIRGLAIRMNSRRNSELDETAPLPADVENQAEGQRFVSHPLKRATGSSRARRSRFFRRG